MITIIKNFNLEAKTTHPNDHSCEVALQSDQKTLENIDTSVGGL